jgi:acetyl-CoA carboxylase beta subunit
MSWISFIAGGMTVIMGYALYSVGMDSEEEFEEVPESGVIVNDFSGRHVTLSCQSCRKLKRHKEVEPNLFQCRKCKRHVDLRAS